MPDTLTFAAPRTSLLRTLTQWHWVSAALALAGLLLFSATGFTLNRAHWFDAEPVVVTRIAVLPAALGKVLQTPHAKDAPLPAAVQAWARGALAARIGNETAEWADDEVYVSLPEPGGDAWLRIDLETREAEYERTTRGVISYLNDLHKGRHTGAAWQIFIDLIALACVVFAVTGLWILKLHAANRPLTWPLTAAGLVVPLLLALLFVH